jgi:hypothetical protein
MTLREFLDSDAGGFIAGLAIVFFLFAIIVGLIVVMP